MKPTSLAGRALLAVGASLILYALLAGSHYKSLLRAEMGAAFAMSALPADVYAACVLAFAASLAGAVLLADGFQSAWAKDEPPLGCVVRLARARDADAACDF